VPDGSRSRIVRAAALVVVVAAVVVAAVTWTSYRRDLAAAKEEIARGSRLVETPCGLIEYASSGDGPPLLVVHGAGGGYDQGLLLGRMVLGSDFRLIAPSRFGYLRTPIPAEPSLAAQADAHACLLDALEVDRVGVVGISAGGPSSLEFALSHPDRTSALVTFSAVSLPSTPPSATTAVVVGAFLRSDLVYWLLLRRGRPLLLRALGVTPEVQARLTPRDDAILTRALEAMIPMSRRREGILLDGEMFADLDQPLERITVPALVIHALDDTLVSYDHGVHTAGRIPGARFVSLESGGHFLAGRHERVRAETVEFLGSRSPR
jgi:pimeloyl-ACP methyl ester carboxylesterase